MKRIFFALTAMFFVASGFAQQTSTLFSDYTNIKNALVNGDAKTAAQAAAVFEKSLMADDGFDQKKSLQKSANEIANANNLDKQRTAFSELSVNLWKVIKNGDKLNQPVYYDYCPMKKAYWISEAKEIKNPYYGASMLTCGKVAESK